MGKVMDRVEEPPARYDRLEDCRLASLDAETQADRTTNGIPGYPPVIFF